MTHQGALQLAESIQGMISLYHSSSLSLESHNPGLLVENYGICPITPPVKINNSMKHIKHGLYLMTRYGRQMKPFASAFPAAFFLSHIFMEFIPYATLFVAPLDQALA